MNATGAAMDAARARDEAGDGHDPRTRSRVPAPAVQAAGRAGASARATGACSRGAGGAPAWRVLLRGLLTSAARPRCPFHRRALLCRVSILARPSEIQHKREVWWWCEKNV